MSNRIQDEPPGDKHPMTQDEILEYYLKNTSYYRQTMLSISTATESVWKKQVLANGPNDTKEKLKTFWTSISLVSALLLGVTYSSAVNPVKSDNEDKAMAASVAAVFSGISLVLSLSVIVVSIIYYIEVDNTTNERDLTDFINANASFVDILTGVFSASVICLMVSSLSTMYVTYGLVEFFIVTGISGVIAVIGAVFAAILAGHNRFRIWIRFSSVESQQLMNKAREHETQLIKMLKEELAYQTRELREVKDLLELKELKDRFEGRTSLNNLLEKFEQEAKQVSAQPRQSSKLSDT